MDTDLIRLCSLGPLALLLGLAAWRDLASYRIPNAIPLGGLALALGLHFFLPSGYGFLALVPGGAGLQHALAGAGIGLAALLPLYFIRATGAGDVKLMAMVGAFVGPMDATGVALATYLAGMALALGAMARSHATQRVLANLRVIAHGAAARLAATAGPSFDPRTETAVRLPYSLAIAAGTASWALWRLA
jgi:prepilin peptidase CpaA